MEARVVRLGARRVLVCRPRGQALGLLVGDVIVALHVARADGLPLLLLARRDAGSPLLRVRCEGVERIEPRDGVGLLVRAVWPAVGLRDRVTGLTGDARNAALSMAQRALTAAVEFHGSAHPLSLVSVWSTVARWHARARGRASAAVARVQKAFGRAAVRLGGGGREDGKDVALRRAGTMEGWQRTRPAKAPSVRDRIKVARDGVVGALERRKGGRWDGLVHRGHDVRRYAAREPLRIRLAQDDERRAGQLATSAGLEMDRPLVTLHVREGAHRAAMGVEDRNRDTIRNARISTYFPAIDELVRRGFMVVRIGDPSMARIERPGVVDLATRPDHAPLLDFWCVSRSRFFIASDSGPYLLSWLFDVPCLAVNVVNFVGIYPLRTRDLYIIKRARERGSGRFLSLSEMLSEKFVYGFRRRLAKDPSLELVDNTEEEILAATVEMVESLDCERSDTPSQARYRELVRAVRSGPMTRDKLRDKTGLDESYLGDGRMADSFAARYLGA